MALLSVNILASIVTLSLIYLQGIQSIFYQQFPCHNCIQCLGGDQHMTSKYAWFKCELQNQCPDECSTEYSYLRQIEYMYRNLKQIQNVPCYQECYNCRKEIPSYYRNFKPLDGPYLETIFQGIFFDDKNKYKVTAMKKPNKPISRRKKRSADCDCETSSNIQAFMDTLMDADDSPWYAIWFRSDGTIRCQYYERITCGSSCHSSDTIRSFLTTSWPPHAYHGHSFALFNYQWLGNVKFQQIPVEGYCEHD